MRRDVNGKQQDGSADLNGPCPQRATLREKNDREREHLSE
jgi:hypothetical protein